MTIPDSEVWNHLHHSGEADAYRLLTDDQRKEYDAYVQWCYNDDHKAYFDGRGRRNPDTVHNWAPHLATLKEWVERSPTGRVSKEPNMQGIPIRTPEVAKIKEAFRRRFTKS